MAAKKKAKSKKRPMVPVSAATRKAMKETLNQHNLKQKVKKKLASKK